MNYNYIVNCSVLARKSDANKISRFLVSDYGATVKAHTAKEFIQFNRVRNSERLCILRVQKHRCRSLSCSQKATSSLHTHSEFRVVNVLWDINCHWL